MHKYKTLLKASIGEYKEKGSKFFGYAYPVEDEDSIKNHLDVLKKEHFKARHHCYAYRLGIDNNVFRANDDGEPSGTAGKPILGRIDSSELTNVLIVVVRYFGGTKLGVSGLITAYKTAAEDAINNGMRVERDVKVNYKLTFPYICMNDVMNLTKKLEIDISDQKYEGEFSVFLVQVNANRNEDFQSLAEDLTELKIEQLS